jgi:hypothetical protein
MIVMIKNPAGFSPAGFEKMAWIVNGDTGFFAQRPVVLFAKLPALFYGGTHSVFHSSFSA